MRRWRRKLQLPKKLFVQSYKYAQIIEKTKHTVSIKKRLSKSAKLKALRIKPSLNTAKNYTAAFYSSIFLNLQRACILCTPDNYKLSFIGGDCLEEMEVINVYAYHFWAQMGLPFIVNHLLL